MVVWKWSINLEDIRHENAILMPEGARVLAVANQYEALAIWALAEPEAPRRSRTFQVVGTGHPISSGGIYVGTAQFREGALVLHVFET